MINFLTLLNKIEKEEQKKIRAEIKNLTVEELEELREKAKDILNNYSPTKEGHDKKTAFINYIKYETDYAEIVDALKGNIK